MQFSKKSTAKEWAKIFSFIILHGGYTFENSGKIAKSQFQVQCLAMRFVVIWYDKFQEFKSFINL